MKRTHGESCPPTARYIAWQAMRQRCNYSKHVYWEYYGGRGIKICSEWDNYETFADDMGPHPGKGWTLERKNSDKDYSKANCLWATHATQARNRRSTKLNEIMVRELRLRHAAGETYSALAKRFSIGLSTAINAGLGNKWKNVP